ncbi:unnamed protein product [Mytilus coruscus]|uniref:B box-type domain-containing protein n=1 Tax=Mytilus coruscus TaxID=42192 RepID=A0A6J8C9X7_MYTCO|nr:unnamed protein product [Mytilus coruscus]
MASILNVQCGTCEYEGRTKNANIRCTNCEEGFCEECEKAHKSMKVSRHHKIISIEDYVCVICIDSEHKSCSSSDVISIEEVSKRAKQFTAFSDSEEIISRTLGNVKHYINDREIAFENVDKDELTIRKTIEDTRLNLNEYLDELERKLLLDLRSKHANHNTLKVLTN